MYHDHAFKSPITRREHAQNCLQSALAASRPMKEMAKTRHRHLPPAIIAVVCVANTTMSQNIVMRFDHLTLGGVYQATPWCSIYGDLGVIVRTDDGNHSWFPIRFFRPVNRARLHIWPPTVLEGRT